MDRRARPERGSSNGEDSRAAPSARVRAAPISSSALCPACKKPVDTLRAGQVAILDGVFRYFCDAACKSAYVDAASKRPALEALTTEPPPVSSNIASVAVVASRVSERAERDSHGGAR